MTGDRNVGIGSPGQSAPIIAVSHTMGNNALGTTYVNTWAWSANDQHLKVGNIGYADGSVAEVSVSGFQQALALSTNGTPWITQYFNFPN